MSEFLPAFAWTILGVMIGIAIMKAVQAYREIKAEEKDGDSDND